MANKKGQDFTRQYPARQIVARNVNQFIGPCSAFTRMGSARGIIQQSLFGGIPFFSGPGLVVAIGRIGPDGIDGADWTDPQLPVSGKGDVVIFVRTEDGGVPKGTLEPCENWYHGAATANWAPVFLLKIDGEVWTIVTRDCINAPLP